MGICAGDIGFYIASGIIIYSYKNHPNFVDIISYYNQMVIKTCKGEMLDVMLPQIFAGERFTKKELIDLGDGGLCQKCCPCHYPNCTFGRY